MKKFFAVLFIVVGLLSIVLSFVAYDSYIGGYESSETYGGDAYPGIQNAAAQTANNVKTLAELVAFSTGSILLVAGLFMIVFGLFNLVGPKQPKQQPVAYAPAAPQPPVYVNAPVAQPVYRPVPQPMSPQMQQPIPQPAPQPVNQAEPPVNP